jgi:hypothetical protein
MWKHALESLAGPDSSELTAPSGAARLPTTLWRCLVEAALLLSLLLTSSWLSGR